MRWNGCVFALVLYTSVGLARGDAGLIPPAAALKTDRPRLLVRPTSSRLAIPLSKLRHEPRDKNFETMLAQLKRLEDADAQAMVWLLTQDPGAATKAIRRMSAYHLPARVDTFEAWFRLREFALAYDWLYDAPGFTPAIRAQVRAHVAPLAREAVQMGDDHVFHNYTWMSDGGLLLWGLATAGEDADADRLYETARQRFNLRLYPAMHYLDGLPSEPMGYWSHYVFTSSVWTILAAQSASETDLIDIIAKDRGNWFKRILETEVQFTLPDMRFVPWGDMQEGPNGGVTQEMAGMIDAATWASKSQDGQWFGQWLAKRRGLSRFYGTTAIGYMLYTRTLQVTHETAPPPPLSYLGGNHQGGQFIARSGWGDGDTVIGFRCADFYGDHHHYDQGSFLICRRGLLAVDPLIYKHVRGPQARTEYHNTLLIGGKPQRQARGQSFTTLQAFEQNLTAGKHLETGDVLWSKDAGAWAGVAGQFAQAYDVSELKSCTRQLLFIRPGTLIVVDRLAAVAGKQVPEIQWLLQLPRVTGTSNDAVTGANEQCWIRCRALLPASHRPTVTATPVNTQRASFTYAGGEHVTLVHAIDIGDGPTPAPAAKIEVKPTLRGVEVRLDDATRTTYLFGNAPQYEVTTMR